MTLGFEIANSKPSLLIVSINTDKWSSPLPETINLSGLSPCSTLKATFDINSLSNLSFIFLDVTNLPSLPANGESLTWKVMLTVGSSTLKGGSASMNDGSQIVSEIFNLSIPEMQKTDPASALLISILSSP